MSARDELRERVAKALGDYYRHAGGVVLRSDERKADAILSALLSPENRPLLLEVLGETEREVCEACGGSGTQQWLRRDVENHENVYVDEPCPSCAGSKDYEDGFAAALVDAHPLLADEELEWLVGEAKP